MIERVTKENLDQYEAFIKKHPKGLFQHSSKWAKVKSAWKWEAVMLRDEDGNIKGSADSYRAGDQSLPALLLPRLCGGRR